MMQLNKEQIKQAFHNEMVLIYKRITKELKYKSPRLIDLINKNGGYEAAIKYLATESSVQDFAVLWENERLDLSVEALIISEKYRDIFDESIVTMCDKKLKEYSYAPLKVEEPEEEELVFYDEIKNKEIAQEAKKLYQYCDYDIAVTMEMWKEVLVNTQLVSAKNLDLLLRIYLIGDDVTAEDLCKEEGYTATYPYKDVVSAMAKRIKSYLKIDVPMDNNNKPLWWHLIFVGGLKDNKCFEWSLRYNLRTAIKELVEESKVSIDDIEVSTHKNVIPRQETILKVQDDSDETKELQGEAKSNDVSDFDKLFESIMGIAKSDNDARSVEETKPNNESITEAKEEEISVESRNILSDTDSTIYKDIINTAIDSDKSVASTNNESDDIGIKEHLTNKERIKKECIEYYGAICDICGFDYGYTYGEQYESEIEVHNINGYVEDNDEILEDSDPVKDLIPICRNCHHIIHNSKNPVSVDKLREMIKM